MSLRLGLGLGVGPRNDASVTPTVAPTNTSAPVVTGVGYLGQVLSCGRGVWAGMPGAFAYQWQRDGVDIPGETGPTYTVTLADEGAPVRCGVVASNRIGTSAVAYSAPVEQWVPTDFAGLVRWYDPADAASVSVTLGRIAAIAPRFGSGDLTQGSASNQPLYGSVNGMGAIECDTFGKSMNWGGLALAQDLPFTIAVGTAPPYAYTSPRTGRLEMRGSGGRFAFMAWAVDQRLVGAPGSPQTVDISPALIEPQSGVSSRLFSKTAGSEYANVTAYFNSTDPASMGSTAPTVGNLANGNINAVGTTGNRGTCSYLDLILCDTAMDAATVAKWQGYLAWRYRDTSNLAADHPYKSSPPTVPIVAAPSAVAAVASAPGQIMVGWTDETAGTARFQVLRRVTGEAEWTDLGLTSIAATEYTDTGLAAGAIYEYRVRAIDAVTGDPSLWAVRASSGGVVVYDRHDHSHWTVHLFNSDGDLTAPAELIGSLLLIGGGGGGGYGAGSGGGGGGAGRRIRQDLLALEADTYAFVIGAGGSGAPGSSGPATDGSVSTFIGGSHSILAEGGGRGANGAPGLAIVGASAGGAGSTAPADAIWEGDQSDGGARGIGSSEGNRGAGGGGGAGEAGATSDSQGAGGKGGDGVDDWGTFRAAGGGGAVRFASALGGGQGGQGGGGRGTGGNGVNGGSGGAANTGSGGGGGTASGFSNGYEGGSGVGMFRVNRSVSAMAQAT